MNLRDRLQRMLQIVEESERTGALAEIERDILLAELREAYAELKMESGKRKAENEELKTENQSVAELPITPIAPIAPAEEPEQEPEERADEPEERADEPEVEVELVFAEEDNDEEVEDSSEEKEESGEEKEESGEKIEDNLSTLNSQLSTPKRSALLSLYEDNPAPVLGEQFHEAPSVADTIACPKGVAESAPIASLRRAIGVADKFMLIRELFGGDADAYEVAITALEEQPSFDDCIIYIAEHYTWSPNSQAAKLIMELLQRKFN